jgi:hypothetical protein
VEVYLGFHRILIGKIVCLCVCGIPIHIHLIYAVIAERLDGVGNLHHVCELACFVACVCVCACVCMCMSERACNRDTQTAISELMRSFVFVRVSVCMCMEIPFLALSANCEGRLEESRRGRLEEVI